MCFEAGREGDLEDLSTSLTELDLDKNTEITGDIKDLLQSVADACLGPNENPPHTTSRNTITRLIPTMRSTLTELIDMAPQCACDPTPDCKIHK